jgi:hypothetical protein
LRTASITAVWYASAKPSEAASSSSCFTELYRLARARRPAVQNVGAHGAQQRLDAVVEEGVRADQEG